MSPTVPIPAKNNFTNASTAPLLLYKGIKKFNKFTLGITGHPPHPTPLGMPIAPPPILPITWEIDFLARPNLGADPSQNYPASSELRFVTTGDRVNFFAICVNFSGKQCNFLHNLRRSTRFTHNIRDFIQKPLKFYTLNGILTKKLFKLLISMHLKIVTIYALLGCKFFGPKIWSCKFFDKSHVWWWATGQQGWGFGGE